MIAKLLISIARLLYTIVLLPWVYFENQNYQSADSTIKKVKRNLLLLELLRFKIGFHDQKLFRDYKEFNRDNSNSKNRIEALTRSLNEVRRLMASVRDAGQEVEIDCVIKIHTKVR